MSKKISELNSLGSTPASGDLLAIVDVSDTSQSVDGSTKKVTFANLEGSIDHGNLTGLSTGADHSYIDQDVTSGSSPTLDGTNFTGIPASALPDADDDGATKGVATFDNTDFNAVAGVVTIVDSGIDHGNLSGLDTGADHSYIDQDVTSGSSPTLDGTNFTGIPDGAMDTDYAEVAGDTYSGVHDFGGATSVEIPNGTSVTVDAAGEIALDTDGDNSTVIQGVLKAYDGSNVVNYFGVAGYPTSDNDVMAYDSGTNTVTWQAQTGSGGTGAPTDAQYVTLALDGDLSAERVLTAGTGVSLADGGANGNATLSTDDSAIVHDDLSGFVPNEHIDHTSVTLTAGNGLSGGGDISSDRTFALDVSELGVEATIAATDYIVMEDVTDNGSQKITFANFEGTIDHGNLTGLDTGADHSYIDQDVTSGAGPRFDLPEFNEAVDMTATSTELNIMDGVTATTAELNLLDGVTATTAELNIVDGGDTTNKVLQAQVGARAYLSTDQTDLTNATNTVVELDTESYDIGNDFNTTTHKFTTPVAGYYYISCQVRFSSLPEGEDYYAVRVEADGSLILFKETHSSNTSNMYVGISDIVYIASGVDINLEAYQASGVNVVDVSGSSAFETFLTIHLMSV